MQAERQAERKMAAALWLSLTAQQTHTSDSDRYSYSAGAPDLQPSVIMTSDSDTRSTLLSSLEPREPRCRYQASAACHGTRLWAREIRDIRLPQPHGLSASQGFESLADCPFKDSQTRKAIWSATMVRTNNRGPCQPLEECSKVVCLNCPSTIADATGATDSSERHFTHETFLDFDWTRATTPVPLGSTSMMRLVANSTASSLTFPIPCPFIGSMRHAAPEGHS